VRIYQLAGGAEDVEKKPPDNLPGSGGGTGERGVNDWEDDFNETRRGGVGRKGGGGGMGGGGGIVFEGGRNRERRQ